MEQFKDSIYLEGGYDDSRKIDFTYVVKKAANYRVFSNPMIMSDMIEFINDSIVEVVGSENVKLIQFIDQERTFYFDIAAYNSCDATTKVETIHSKAMDKFYAKYYQTVLKAISEQSGYYANMFSTMMCGQHRDLLISLLSTRGQFAEDNGYYRAFIRMY